MSKVLIEYTAFIGGNTVRKEFEGDYEININGGLISVLRLGTGSRYWDKTVFATNQPCIARLIEDN